jgi:hypothetical protein
MFLGDYIAVLHQAQRDLAEALRQTAQAHEQEADVKALGQRLAAQCDRHAELLAEYTQRYPAEEPQSQQQASRFRGTRGGGTGLLRDLQDLFVMAAECDIGWTLVGQAAQGARDRELLDVVHRCEGETAQQLAWLRSRLKQTAPQALVVAES